MTAAPTPSRPSRPSRPIRRARARGPHRLNGPVLGLALALGFGAAGPLALPAAAHEITAGSFEIIHPMIPLPPRGAKTAAGYMAIANEGDTPDTLVGIETAIARRAEVHGTQMDGTVAKMQAVPRLEIPAGETVLLEPGGLHVMLMGLTGPLAEGDMIPATLVFDRAGRVEIEFMVDPADGGGAMDHMSHGN
ncbi:copper chaperone PCu(A)C [Frigidibacter sp. MR17.24]|uniref:copper chaperone PCu(A)C n=1 Tax=Frigidibacter sp. MR17.24 TaxID=3127345 RepID=UPI003012B57C